MMKWIELSKRELQIVELTALGGSYKEVARVIGISEQTIKNHYTSIRIKTDSHSTTEAIVKIKRQQWEREHMTSGDILLSCMAEILG